jgi:Spy/CpxP family protein refolding chaperone
MEDHMKAKHIILTITAAVLIAAPGVLVAQHGPGTCDGDGPHGRTAGPGGGFGGRGGAGILRMLPRLAERLELTGDQQAQIDTIIDETAPAIQDLRDQAAANREAFRETHELGDFNEPEYRAHFEVQAQIHVEMQLTGAQAAARVWQVLTPDQQQELLDLIELFHSDRGPRHGGGKRFGSH